METVMTYDLDHIDKAAQWLLAQIKTCHIIAFQGDMGAGKTTLIKSICQQLKVKDETSSPTFNIINQYQIDQQRMVYHIDFYRIKDPEEMIDLGIFDIFDSGQLCLLEWPLLIENLLPDTVLWAVIDKMSDFGSTEQRRLSVRDSPAFDHYNS